jgi:hypothetical protein
MATFWLTNRGKFLQVTGAGLLSGATDFYLGAFDAAAVPAAIDTEAEIQDLNTVAEVLALTGVDEPVVAGYGRIQITSITPAEDDTNNRVNIDSADIALGSLATGANIRCGFVFKEGGTDAQDQLYGIWILDATIPTNGSGITFTVTDLVRAT